MYTIECGDGGRRGERGGGGHRPFIQSFFLILPSFFFSCCSSFLTRIYKSWPIKIKHEVIDRLTPNNSPNQDSKSPSHTIPFERARVRGAKVGEGVWAKNCLFLHVNFQIYMYLYSWSMIYDFTIIKKINIHIWAIPYPAADCSHLALALGIKHWVLGIRH